MLQHIKTQGGGKYLSAGNDFCDKNGVEIGKEGCLASSEEFLVKTNSGIKDLAQKIIPKGEKATIWIDLVCQDGKSTGRNGTEGNYVVTFYHQDPKRKTSAAGKNTTYEADNLEEIKLASVTIPVDSTNYAIIKAKAAQTYLGFYANVYGGKTLTGTWELLDLEGAAEPVELEQVDIYHQLTKTGCLSDSLFQLTNKCRILFCYVFIIRTYLWSRFLYYRFFYL